MNTLQDLLTTLGLTQKLAAGYLTPVGAGSNPPNAHDTVRALKQQFDPINLLQNPLPSMTGRGSPTMAAPNILFCPAWVASLGAGQDAIFLEDVMGRIDSSHTPQPAYLFVM